MPEGDAFRRCYSPDMLRKLDAYLSELKEEYCIQVVDVAIGAMTRNSATDYTYYRMEPRFFQAAGTRSH